MLSALWLAQWLPTEVKAADAVWGASSNVLSMHNTGCHSYDGGNGLAGCGLSNRKIEYICDLAKHFAMGQLNPEGWGMLDDRNLN